MLPWDRIEDHIGGAIALVMNIPAASVGCPVIWATTHWSRILARARHVVHDHHGQAAVAVNVVELVAVSVMLL